MVARRDIVVANDIAEMAALGWFAEEFIVYGCCYVENGTVFYKVSSQNTELYRFKETCLKQGIYVSPVVELLNRVAVPSGMQDEYLLRTKIKLAKQLRRDYDTDAMQQFSKLAERDGNDSAAELLYDLKQKLLGCFEQELLQLAESIVDYAFQQKKLKRKTYEEFCQWFAYVYSQMEDDVVIRKNFQRTFYGFAYKNSTGGMRSFTNASESETKKKREELLCKGIHTTPILKKVYYFDNQPNLANVKENFLQQLNHWMDEEYWWYLNTIDNLPTFVSTEEAALLQRQISESQLALRQFLQYYCCIWHVL